MIRLLVITDDFTGALDTGVQFAARVVDTRVLTETDVDFNTVPDCEVLVLDAETRHLPPEQAYKIVAKVTNTAIYNKIPFIYKKTDSALRGNVGAELTALLRTSGEDMLPFFPSFPQMDRCTKGGIHYIKDVPVAESVFGKDPFEPVRHSKVSELIAEQSDIFTQSLSKWTKLEDNPEARGIVIFDGVTMEELEHSGRALKETGQLHIMAGCAGFAAILPTLLELDTRARVSLPVLDPRMLVICGSVNPITVEQLDVAEKRGFIRIRLTPEQKLVADYWDTEQGIAELNVLRNVMKKNPFRIIETNDADGNQITAEYANTLGMDIQDIRKQVSQSVGCIVSRIFSCADIGTLLVTGGDTLLQCMRYMGAHELQPLCELDTGVVLSRFTHQGYTRYVISKSGGFGDRDLVGKIVEQLQATYVKNKEASS